MLIKWENCMGMPVPLEPTPTGHFDEPTEVAVIHFQQAAGLPVSGAADPATWKALLRVPYASPNGACVR